MTFDVGATPHSQWQALKPLLESFGWGKTQTTDPETWYRTDSASAGPAAKYLLLHTRPEVAIAHAMEDGTSPAGAVEEWRSAAERLVTFYRRNRANTLVIEVTSALQEPLVCSEAIRDRLQLEAPTSLPKLAPFPKPEPLNQLLANQLISQSNELSHLLAELEACTLPLTDEVVSSPSVEVQALYKQLQSDARDKLDEELTTLKAEKLELERELEEAREEAGLTLNQLTITQKQLDAQREQNSRIKADALQQQQEREHDVDALRREEEQLKKALEEAQKEGELTLHQLFSVQEELEQYYLQNKSLLNKDEAAAAARKRLEEQSKASEQHKAELAQLTQERDRLQQQVLSLTKNQTSSAKSIEEAKEEAELTLEQLSYSQKQLAETERQLSRTRKQLDKHANDCAQYKAEVEKLTRERDQIKQQQARLTTDEEKLKKALEEARDEGDLTLHQLFKVQEELERYYLDNKALHKSMAEKDSKLTWLRSSKKRLEESLKKSKNKNQKLEESLKQRAKNIQDLNRALKQKKADVESLSSTLQSVYASASWKVSAPLRAIAMPFTRVKKRVKQQAVLIEQSPYFDTAWYLQQYSDVAKGGWNAAEHYIMHGAQEGRDPSPLFDTRRYLETYTDVAKDKLNPLVHFIEFGEAEGRSPKP